MFKKIIETVIGDIQSKKDYKLYKKRVAKLPNEYKKTMQAIQTYMQNFGSLDGSELYDILDMFEIAIADGRKVNELIGNDIITFCDGVIQANPEKTWINSYKKKISQKMSKELRK